MLSSVFKEPGNRGSPRQAEAKLGAGTAHPNPKPNVCFLGKPASEVGSPCCNAVSLTQGPQCCTRSLGPPAAAQIATSPSLAVQVPKHIQFQHNYFQRALYDCLVGLHFNGVVRWARDLNRKICPPNLSPCIYLPPQGPVGLLCQVQVECLSTSIYTVDPTGMVPGVSNV